MPAATVSATITLGRVRRDVLDPVRVRRARKRLSRRSSELEHEDWKIVRLRSFLSAKSQGKVTEWSMPIQGCDLFGEPRPYDIDSFLWDHVYIAKQDMRLALGVWETQKELHALFATLRHLAEHPYFDDEMSIFMPALLLFELTPGDDQHFFYTLIESE